MPKSGTLTKAHIVEAVAEANGYSRNRSIETDDSLTHSVKSCN